MGWLTANYNIGNDFACAGLNNISMFFISDLDNSIYHTHVAETIPSFSGPIQNVTVNVGREAVLECPVNQLGQYKVKNLKTSYVSDDK